MAISQNRPINNTLYHSYRKTKEQGLFLKRLGTLLSEGFSLKEALDFLITITEHKQLEWLNSINQGVNRGEPLYQELHKCGFSDRICTQIYLSTIHGRFSETILIAGEQLIETAQRKKKIQSIIQYPIMLLIFIVLMLFSMRYILLPHIQRIVSPDETSMGIGTKLIIGIVYTAPYWLIGIGILGILSTLIIYSTTRKKSAIEKLTFYNKNRIVRPYLQLYWTQFFAFEWSQLLKSNCSLIQIVQLMQQDQSSQLFQEVGYLIEKEMRKGHSFQESIAQLAFLKSEMNEITIHGELSGRLGSELILYASDCEVELNQRIETMMERIQPAVFIFVSLMIIAIYAALLLPTFSIMEGL